MLQTLFHIPCELFGWPVFGFGLLLAVWAVASAALLAWLIRRQGFNADTQGHALVLGVLGLAIAFLLPLLCEPRGLPIRGYGMMMLLAVLSGIGLAAYRARRVGVDPEMIFTLAFWLILPGILGARAVYVCEYWFRDFWPAYGHQDFDFWHVDWHGLGALLFAVVNIAAGGLVVYGSFFGAMLGLGLFWWRHRVPLLATADLIAPSLLLGLALGRVGCLLNGCCYGGPCDLPWGVTFPWNSPVHQHEAEQGITGVFGLKFGDAPNDRAVIESVDSDALPLAARKELTAGTKIDEINGVRVRSSAQSNEESSAFACSCSHGSEGVTAKGQAARAVLGIDKLILILRGSRGEALYWSIDDPPESEPQGSGVVKIFGLEIAGPDDHEAVITGVRWQSPEAWFRRHAPLVIANIVAGFLRRQSPEAAAGIHAGQWVESINGRKVDTIGRLRQLLDEHRRHPWLDILPAAPASGSPTLPVELAVDRPLPRSEAVHPTQFYSTIDALILCLLLLCYDRFRRRDGELTALILTIYPITRFLIEGIRTDEPGIWLRLHISQIISLGLLPVAICLWIYILRRPAKLAFDE